jgi:hypothetical protein
MEPTTSRTAAERIGGAATAHGWTVAGRNATGMITYAKGNRRLMVFVTPAGRLAKAVPAVGPRIHSTAGAIAELSA